jgi:hypothetical protein
VEFEDTPTLGRFQRTVEIDPIDGANEPDTERYASPDRSTMFVDKRAYAGTAQSDDAAGKTSWGFAKNPQKKGRGPR